MDLERFASLKARVESLRAERDQSVGAEKELKKRLKDEFGCATVAEARTLLHNLDDQIVVLERKYTKAMQILDKDWGKRLEKS